MKKIESDSGEETIFARELIISRAEHFGLAKELAEWLSHNLSDKACQAMYRLNKLMPPPTEGQIGVSMMDEEIVGAVMILQNPELTGQILAIPEEELSRWQQILTLGTLYSDLGKVEGEGEMTWLYNNFRLNGDEVKNRFYEWRTATGSPAASPQEMPWEDAKKLYRSIFFDGSAEDTVWDRNSKALEKKLKSWGWDLAEDSTATFGDVMTRAHVIALQNSWEELAGEVDPAIAEEVRMIALNHHLTRGFPPGDEPFWERTGLSQGVDGENLRVRGEACLFAQLVDAVTAAMCRPRREGDPFFRNAKTRISTNLDEACSAGRLSREEKATLDLWMANLPEDQDETVINAVQAVLSTSSQSLQ